MPDLTGRALIFCLSLKYGRRSTKDEDAEEEIARTKNAQKAQCSVNKKFFPPNAFDEIVTLSNRWKNQMKKITLPWDKGQRIVVCTAREKLEALCRDFSAQRDKLIEDWLDRYPTYADNAPTYMGDLYDASEFPTHDEMVRGLSHTYTFFPLPDAAAMFVEGASEEKIAEIRENAQREIESRFAAGQAHAWNRIMTPVREFVERLAAPEEVITQSTIDALRRIVDLIPDLNLTNDPELESFRLQVRQTLAGFNASTVRDSQSLRNQMASDGRALLSQFGQLGKRKFTMPEPQVIQPASILPGEMFGIDRVERAA